MATSAVVTMTVASMIVVLITAMSMRMVVIALICIISVNEAIDYCSNNSLVMWSVPSIAHSSVVSMMITAEWLLM
jgi:hypothetical protein